MCIDVHVCNEFILLLCMYTHVDIEMNVFTIHSLRMHTHRYTVNLCAINFQYDNLCISGERVERKKPLETVKLLQNSIGIAI